MARFGWLLGLAVLSLASSLLAQEAPSSSSSIIPSAGTVTLINGNGDLNPEGACVGDIENFCKDSNAGDGRIAACLSARQQSEKKGNVAGRQISDQCLEELTKFKIDRSQNINHDVILARACKDDVAKICASVSDARSPGSVSICLRQHKPKLSSSCQAEVFRVQQEAVADYRTDPQLFAACGQQVKNLCTDVEEGDSREVECLEDKRMQVSWDCLSQIGRMQQETGDDIRLSVKLFTKCLADSKKFCKDVQPGHMRVQECLEDNMDKSGFSAGCKQELEEQIARRVSDFKLDTALREACEDDLRDSCAATLDQMDEDDKIKASALNCLQQYKDELRSDKCKAQIHRMGVRASRDIRFDEVLAAACTEDRNRYCQDVQPGSARVIRCLQEHRNSLAQRCAAAMFDHEVRMAEDIDFKYPMKRSCAWEISSFCKSIPHGHARIIRCLEQQLDHPDMSKECRDEVERDMNRMGQDYRLNFRLNKACEADMNKLCNGLCSSTSGLPCGGIVLQCLQEKQDNITSKACQEEVFYYELMEVTDFRNDVILAEACRDDVDKYCSEVQPGEGRVHQCLRFNRDLISERCRKEEMKLATVEARDIRLRPKLNKVCSEEKAVYCKGVKPGKARVIKCLMENMGQPNFGEECKSELEKREDAMKNDYRFDVGVSTNCAADIDVMCAEQKTKLRGNATVLRCLVDDYRKTSDPCQTELSRAVRFALWDYKPQAALTQVCDADVTKLCPKGKSRNKGVFTIGVVGRCLSKSLVEGKPLSGKCRDLVLVAAPKDTRAYFEYPESTSMLVQKVAEMQRAAGLEAVLVDPYARSGSAVTVTGWVALACIMSLIVVAVGGSYMLYRRVTGADKPHTVHVKMGDM